MAEEDICVAYRQACAKGGRRVLEALDRQLAGKRDSAAISVIHTALAPECLAPIIDVATNTQFVRVLQLKAVELDLHGVRQLCTALQHSKSLTTLALSCNPQLSDPAAQEEVRRLLDKSETLRQLTLDECDLKDSGIKVLCSGDAVSKLRALNLRHNDVTDEGALVLGRALSRNTVLEEIILRANRITSRGVIALTPLLGCAPVFCACTKELGFQSAKHRWWRCSVPDCKHPSGFRCSLDASSHDVVCKCGFLVGTHEQNGTGTWECVCRGRITTGSELGLRPDGVVLKELRLRENALGDLGAEVLGEALRTNTSVKTVELQDTQATSIGLCRALHALDPDSRHLSLPWNSDASELELSYNEGGPQLAATLGALMSRRKFKSLCLRKLRLSESGARELLKTVTAPRPPAPAAAPPASPEPPPGRPDDVQDPLPLSPPRAAAPAAALHLADSIPGPPHTEPAVEAPAAVGCGALQAAENEWTALGNLDLSDNELGDEGLRLVSAVMPHLTSLRAISLRSNNISSEGMTQFADRLRGYPISKSAESNWVCTLQEIDVADNRSGYEGGAAWLQVVEEVSSLRKLQLVQNEIPAMLCQALQKSQDKNEGLKQLKLNNQSRQERRPARDAGRASAGAMRGFRQ
eukprot:TRINITY_DN11778_c0_g1_i2.p1 TRINITY_DN11778_c0_g1~~TRINITY_DN11778_c0_g1_i2.p1  ORF type:complete len:659 (+),score=183.22 TRINITY_DN11778_c0_g1_i2:64-1977(+)